MRPRLRSLEDRIVLRSKMLKALLLKIRPPAARTLPFGWRARCIRDGGVGVVRHVHMDRTVGTRLSDRVVRRLGHKRDLRERSWREKDGVAGGGELICVRLVMNGDAESHAR